jgi:hypothetical protein
MGKVLIRVSKVQRWYMWMPGVQLKHLSQHFKIFFRLIQTLATSLLPVRMTRLWLGLTQLWKLSIQLLRKEIVDGDLAYFPERYGWYLVPAALALMYGNPIPSHIYIENVIVTPANVGQFYPE